MLTRSRSCSRLGSSNSELADHFVSLSVSPPAGPASSSSASPSESLQTRRSSRRSATASSLQSSATSTPASKSRLLRKRKRAALAEGERRGRGRPRGSKNKKRASEGDDTDTSTAKTAGLRAKRRALYGSKVSRRADARTIVEPLPGREQEFEQIEEKLRDAVGTRQGCCIYVSGVPGTGKTATVRQCLKYLQHPAQRRQVGDFEVVEVNGMRLSDASQTYSLLWQFISGRVLSGGVALRRLTAHFQKTAARRKPLVLVLDELDLLLKKKSTMLYHFFEWTGWESARLIVVAIANTMDLPERFLSNRIASRMGTNRINFKPYTYPQLMAIIAHRQKDWRTLFHPDALEYCARKVSAVSGDARRAINLAKRAVDWVASQAAVLPASGLITIPVMEQAIQMTFAGNAVQMMRDLASQERILLLAMLLAVRSSGTVAVPFQQACETHWQLLRSNTMPHVGFADLQAIFARLEAMRLIGRECCDPRSPTTASSLVRFFVSQEETVLALGQTAVFQKHLQV